MKHHMDKISKLLFNLTVIAALSYSIAPYSYAGLMLKLAIQEEHQAQNDDGLQSTVKDYEIDILLEDSYFQAKNDDEVIYDFDKNKIYLIDQIKKTYIEKSLFADVGFRDYEIRNRKNINDTLMSAGIENNPLPLVFSEHKLSVLANHSDSKLQRQESNGEIILTGAEHPLLKVSSPSKKVKDKYKQQFIRFFQHRYGIHPNIADELTNASGIFTNITLWHEGVYKEKFTFVVVSITETEASSYSLAGLTPTIKTNKKLLTLIENLENTSEANRKKTERNILKDAKQRIEKQDLTGAMLAYLEYTLVSDSQQIPWSEEDKQLLVSSKDVLTMLAATRNPTNKDDAEAKVNYLKTIRANQKTGNHVLKIFEANTRAYLGAYDDSIKLMIDALKVNPYLGGAWKDLGGFYFKSYEANAAWICWDIGRTINPTNTLLNDINQFEDQLKKKHPGFF